MKKGKRLILLLVVLAVFIAGTVALQQVNKANEAAKNTTAPEVVVTSLNKDDLTQISYTYQGETLTFNKNGDNWEYAADTAFPLKQSMITDMASALNKVVAVRKVADTLDQAEDYGLKAPAIVVTATLKDGTKATLNIGDKNASTSDNYVSLEGATQVYTVASTVAEKFSYKLYGLITDEAFPTIDATTAQKLALTTADGSLNLSYMPDGSDKVYSSSFPWLIDNADGSQTPTDESKVSTYLTSLTGITYAGTADYNATQEELAQYGLATPAASIALDYTVSHAEQVPKATDTPAPSATPAPVVTAVPEATAAGSPDAALTPEATATPTAEPTATPTAEPTVTPTAAPTAADAALASASPEASPTPEMETITVTEPKQITIYLGSKAPDGSYYMRHTDSTRVFLISSTLYDTLTKLSAKDLKSMQACLVPLDSVDSLNITMKDSVKTVKITRTQTTDATSGKTSTTTAYTVGDTTLDATTFKTFYNKLISLTAEQTTDKTPQGTPYITVVFGRNTATFTTLQLDIYPYDASFYQVSFNGDTTLLVNKNDVEALLTAYQAIGG